MLSELLGGSPHNNLFFDFLRTAFAFLQSSGHGLNPIQQGELVLSSFIHIQLSLSHLVMLRDTGFNACNRWSVCLGQIRLQACLLGTCHPSTLTA